MWKKFDELNNTDPKFYCSDYIGVELNRCKVKTGTSLRVWENNGWINETDPYGWFSVVFQILFRKKIFR